MPVRLQRPDARGCVGWLNTVAVMPPIYVISLAREAERRMAMRYQLLSHSLKFEIFDAVDGRELDQSNYHHRMQTEWWRRMRGRQMSPGMIGCFLSHYALWERMVETGTPYAAILEDDALLEGDFTVVIEEIMGMAAETNWDVVLLSAKRQYPIDLTLASLNGNRSLVRYRRRVGGTVGYLIRLEAAQALLHYCWRIRAPISWLYAEWWQNGLTFLSVDPAVVRHANFPPVIETQPRVKRAVSEHMAAMFYRLADRLHRRAVQRSVV